MMNMPAVNFRNDGKFFQQLARKGKAARVLRDMNLLNHHIMDKNALRLCRNGWKISRLKPI